MVLLARSLELLHRLQWVSLGIGKHLTGTRGEATSWQVLSGDMDTPDIGMQVSILHMVLFVSNR